MRVDISEYLYHWIRAESEEDAIDKLCSIIENRKLLGGNGFVRGQHTCICFTETPMNLFHKRESRYKKFGVRLLKEHIFKKGGRPVIYQEDDEYNNLPENLKWRHVSFSPPKIDFTWEREWRLNLQELEVEPQEITFIVPHEGFGECLSTTYYTKEYRTVFSAVPESDPYSVNQPEHFKYIVL